MLYVEAHDEIGGELVLSGGEPGRDDFWFELGLGGVLHGEGRFTDTDYGIGQTLFSETFSAVSSSASSASLRIAMPFVNPLELKGVRIAPYLVAHTQARSVTAFGLECGAACPARAALPADMAVIDMISHRVDLGAGIRLERQLGTQGTLHLRAELTGGHLDLRSSHHLRTAQSDLGPTPNIHYQFNTVGMHVETGYTHALNETTSLAGSVFVEGHMGGGTAVLGVSSRAPTPPLPAFASGLAIGVVLGGAVSF